MVNSPAAKVVIRPGKTAKMNLDLLPTNILDQEYKDKK